MTPRATCDIPKEPPKAFFPAICSHKRASHNINQYLVTSLACHMVYVIVFFQCQPARAVYFFGPQSPTMRSDGPSRMVRRPTGSGGEPSSPNRGASAGVKARHHHLQMVDGTGASSLVSLRTIAHQTARVLPDNFVHRRTYTCTSMNRVWLSRPARISCMANQQSNCASWPFTASRDKLFSAGFLQRFTEAEGY